MIEKPTVFVLGAGASRPYGFPTAFELNKNICEGVWNERYIEGLEEFNVDLKYQARELAERLAKATISIDRWLAGKPEKDLIIGRYLIARALMELEDEGAFRRAYLAGRDWYADLWDRLYSGSLEKLAGNQVTFITFNYDRSLEQALMIKMQNTTLKSPEECADMIALHIPIIHVHGQLGRLPWQTHSEWRELTPRPYETKCDLKTVFKCAGNIKIIGETDGKTPEYAQARGALKKAKRIHFLGFGYNAENLQRLHVDHFDEPPAPPAGTYFGLGEWARQQLAGVQNPFGFLIETTSHGHETVTDYFHNMIPGWDEFL